jgi:elongation factor Ts
MAQITAALVKELREQSGAGMLDCKKALAETDGNIEAAIDWLRKKGLSAAAKKAGRVAAEGLVAMKTDGNKGVLLEMNSETDFVARNEQFQEFVSALAGLAMGAGNDVDALKAKAFPGTDRDVAGQVTHMIATIGENMNLRRFENIEVAQGAVVGYMHSAAAEGLGKIGVLVGLESEASADELQTLGKQVAMHVAAASPQALNIEDVDQDSLERERKVLSEQALASGKPAEIVDKMVEGRLRKYYEEVVLNEQIFVVDGETKIKKVVEAAAKELGKAIKLTGYVRMELGQGIEKEEKDFAAEVAEQLNK